MPEPFIERIYSIRVSGLNESLRQVDTMTAKFLEMDTTVLNLKKDLALKIEAGDTAGIQAVTDKIKQVEAESAKLQKTTTATSKELVLLATNTKPQQDAFTKLSAQYKDAVTNAKALAAEYGIESEQAINAANAAIRLKDQLTQINNLVKSGGGQAIPTEIPFISNIPNLEAEEAELLKTGTVVSDFDKKEAEAAISAKEFGDSQQKAGEQTRDSASSYEFIESELDKYTGSLRSNITQQIQNNAALASNKAEQKEIETAIKAAGGATEEQTTRLAALKEQALIIVEANKQLSTTIKIQAKDFASAQDSSVSLEAKLALLINTYRLLSDIEKTSPFGREIKAQIDVLDPKVKALDADIGRFQKNVGNYAGSLKEAFAIVVSELERVRAQIAKAPSVGSPTIVAGFAKLQEQEKALSNITDQLGKGFATASAQVIGFRQAGEQLAQTLGKDAIVVENFNNKVKTFKTEAEGVNTGFGRLTTGFSNLVSSVLVSFGIVSGVQTVINFFKGAITQFNEFEAAVTRLRNVLSNLGEVDAFDRLQGKAERLAAEFRTFDAEEVLDVFQKLITYGKLTENQIDKLSPVIINFAAQQRISLAEASDQITRALEGNARAFKALGINTTDAHTAVERFGIIMEQLAPRVEGAAKAFGETTAGQIKSTQVQIEELQEDIGRNLQPAIKRFYETIAGALDGIQIGFNNLKTNISDFVDSLKLVGGVVKDIFTLDPNNAAVRITTFQVQRDAARERVENIEAVKNAEKQAESITQDAAQKTIVQQKELIKSYTAIRSASAANYYDLKAQQKSLTDEGKKALLQFIQDNKTVNALQQSLAEQISKKKLGFGEDEVDQAAADRAAREAVEREKRKAQAIFDIEKLQTEEIAAFFRKNADNQRLSYDDRLTFTRAFYNTERELLDEQLAFELSKAGLLPAEKEKIKVESHNRLVALQQKENDELTALQQSQAEREFEIALDLENKKAALQKAAFDKAQRDLLADELDIIKNGAEGKLRVIETTSLEQQNALADKRNQGLISEAEYQKQLTDIQKKASKEALEAALKSAESQLDLLTKSGLAGTKQWEELRLAIEKVQNQLKNPDKGKAVTDDLFAGLNEGVTGFAESIAKTLDLSEEWTRILVEGFQLGEQAMNDFFNNEENRVQQSKQLQEDRLQIEFDQRRGRAQSAAEQNSLDRQQAAEKVKIDKEAGEQLKKIKKDEAKISLATELANIAASAAANILNGVTFGAAGVLQYAILSAIALARYAFNISTIDSATFEYGGVPKRGGKFGGQPHSRGGTPFIFKGEEFEAEVDELNIIRTRNSPKGKKYKIEGTQEQIASALNEIGGGVRFSPGAVVRKLSTGGSLKASNKIEVEDIETRKYNLLEARNYMTELMISTKKDKYELVESLNNIKTSYNNVIDRLNKKTETTLEKIEYSTELTNKQRSKFIQIDEKSTKLKEELEIARTKNDIFKIGKFSSVINTEEDYHNAIYEINKKSIDEKLSIVKGVNKQEKTLIEELNIIKLKNEQDNVNKIFAIKTKAINEEKKLYLKLSQSDITEKEKTRLEVLHEKAKRLEVEEYYLRKINHLEEKFNKQVSRSEVSKELSVTRVEIEKEMALGGKVGGRTHAQGGNQFIFKGRVFEDEVDELNIIRTKNAPRGKKYTITGTQEQIASSLNVIGGGIQFAPGADVKRYSFGGMIPESLMRSGFVPRFDFGGSLQPPINPSSFLNNTSNANNQKLEKMVADIAVTVNNTNKRIDQQTENINLLAFQTNSRIDRIKVINVASETAKVNSDRIKASNIGTL